jgi:hypothetical protein
MSDKETDISKKKRLQDYINILVTDCINKSRDNVEDELEVVFGKYEMISKIDFDNVVSKLKSSRFHCINEQGDYHLNIQTQFTDKGYTKMSNIRTTVSGLENIQKYCTSNTLDEGGISNINIVSFLQKRQKKVAWEYLKSIDYGDYNFRINYKNELQLSPLYGLARELIDDWPKRKKIFRLLKRFTFINNEFEYPVKIDMSIVRSSTIKGRGMIPTYMIDESNVFNNPEIFEIEIEVDNKKLYRLISKKKEANDGEIHDVGEFEKELNGYVNKSVNRCIKLILSGLQQTNYPISSNVMNQVLNNYLNVINNKKGGLDRKIQTRDFIGPSSISLEVKNIIPLNADLNIGNIRNPYAVTEKADGLRKLLFISHDGRLYLIDTNMKVQFTGIITKNSKCYNTVIDGEHVNTNKKNEYINLYLAFDIYIINNKDIRSMEFINKKSQNGRHITLNKLLVILDAESVIGGKIPMSIKIKEFEYSDEKSSETIFDKCRYILDNIDRGKYEYETDGLIFTPANTGVGSHKIGDKVPPIKQTWRYSFKWKPPEHNTIDFLTTTTKSDAGNDIVQNIFKNGNDVKEYKTLQLRVGYDEKRHGYLNPVEDVLQDNLPVFSKLNHREYNEYKPVLFYPSAPSLSYPAYLCNIQLEARGSHNVMTIENKSEIIEDETIVEFKFIKNNDELWQWVPIKVRYDKTAEYRKGGRNYGNSYTTAQSVWSSIHNPVTIDMIRGENIPNDADDDVYYNFNNNKTETRALRDFHNLYVKKNLISNVAQRGGTLIDMSVGKGGDLHKWINSKLSFVFGIDLSKDNIENKLDGAYARYLNCCKRFKNLPKVLFINGDSGLNIKNGDVGKDEKAKLIARAIFGNGPKDKNKLGPAVFNKHGVASDGFNIVSNQFSLHYFFKDVHVLNEFIRNVSECCSVGGYFIGCCYDGKKIFELLKNVEVEETKRIVSKNNKDNIMLSIKKMYADTEFKDDETSVGKRIDVLQESINRVFPEYLVNFKYLSRLLSNYGFTELSKEELKAINMPSSIGSFQELYSKMKQDHQLDIITERSVGSSFKMSRQEKEISFLNNYFIFKKERHVNATSVSRTMRSVDPSELESKHDSVPDSTSQKKMISLPPTIKKIGKIIIVTADEETKRD